MLIQYETDKKIWVKIKDIKEQETWVSHWWCDDGDQVELYIKKDEKGFILNCISGIPASYIYIDIVDFGTMWQKIDNKSIKKIESIQNYNYIQQCIIIANWLCNIFCEWKDTTHYTLY